MNRIPKFLFVAIAAIVFSFSTSFAQGTAFNYQGQLYNGGAVANGTFDFRFWVYDSTNNPGVIIAGPVTNAAVFVTNGLFTVQMDFGTGVFTGPDRWLQIAVRTNGALTFTNLSPRQKITPVPYAIFANSASNLIGLLPASQLSGTLPSSAFAGYTNTVALTNSANLFAGSFSGNGANITNVNVANLTGVLVPGQLPSNTAYVNSNQTFTASNSFTGPNNFSGTNFFGGPNTFTNLYGNSFAGSFFGNGLVGWIATNGTAVQAQIDHGYLLTNSQFTTVTLPTNAVAGDIVRVSGAGASGWEIAENAGQSIIGNFLNFGQTWLKSGATSQNWTCIAASTDGSVFVATAGTGAGNVYISTDSGKTWFSTGPLSAGFHNVACSADGSKIIAAVNGGSIYTSTNFGSTWSTAAAALSWSGIASSSDGNKLFASVSGNLIYTNSGASWFPSGAPSMAWSSVVCSSDGTKVAATIGGGTIYTSSNSGRTWSSSGAPTKNWAAIASSSDGTKLAAAINATSAGGIYVSTDSGANWTHTSAPSTNWTAIAASSDGSRLVAVSSTGCIYTSGNGGTTWGQISGVPALSWSSVAMSADGSRIAAAATSSGNIYTSQSSLQVISTTVTSGYIMGGQGSAVELQYIGNNKWMPVSSTGTIWAF